LSEISAGDGEKTGSFGMQTKSFVCVCVCVWCMLLSRCHAPLAPSSLLPGARKSFVTIFADDARRMNIFTCRCRWRPYQRAHPCCNPTTLQHGVATLTQVASSAKHKAAERQHRNNDNALTALEKRQIVNKGGRKNRGTATGRGRRAL